MAKRGFKEGPFKVLETQRTGEGVNAVALVRCTTKDCAETVALQIDGRGWPYESCSVKTGCGRKTESKNKLACEDAFSRVKQWAVRTNKDLAHSLCDKIDLYPAKPKYSGFGSTAQTAIKEQARLEEKALSAPEPTPQPKPKEQPKTDASGWESMI